MTRLLALISIALCCCAPPAPPKVPTDDVPGDLRLEADAACANLRRLSCPEGWGSTTTSCTDVVLRASELRPLPIDCWALADTQAEAVACGALRCVE